MQCSLLPCLVLSPLSQARRAGGGVEIRHSGPRSGIHAFIPDSMTPQQGRTQRSAPTKCNAAFCLVLFLAPSSQARRAGGGPLEIRHSGPRSGIHAFIPDSMTPQQGRTQRSAPTKCNAAFCLVLFLAPCCRQGGPEGGRNPSFRTPIRNPCLHSGFNRGRTHRSAPTKCNAVFCLVFFLAPCRRQRAGIGAGCQDRGRPFLWSFLWASKERTSGSCLSREDEPGPRPESLSRTPDQVRGKL
jgi:hypothetical protein